MASETTASNSAPEASFGFADFLRVVDERRGLIRNVTLGVGALTLLVLFCLPTLYSSSAVVMLEQRKNNVADLSSVLSALPTDAASVQDQIQLLSSRALAERVIGKLKLYDDPEFNPALGGNAAPGIGDLVHLANPANWGAPSGSGSAASQHDAIVSAFLDRLDVSALGLSTSITLSYTSRDPVKAALIANTLADAYMEDQVDTKVAAARAATRWLTDRMHQLAAQVQAGEKAIAEYKAANNLVDRTRQFAGRSAARCHQRALGHRAVRSGGEEGNLRPRPGDGALGKHSGRFRGRFLAADRSVAHAGRLSHPRRRPIFRRSMGRTIPRCSRSGCRSAISTARFPRRQARLRI